MTFAAASGFLRPARRLLPAILVAATCGSFAASGGEVSPQDFSAMVADRAAVEHVYYDHRLGTKPPFEQAMSRNTVEQLVRHDLDKERVLKTIYGVTLSEAEVQVETVRIDGSSRAPDMLAELKHSLGNDPVRFGRAVVKPILVEKRLNQLFLNDAAIVGPVRKRADDLRTRLLAVRQADAGSDQMMNILRAAGTPSRMTWRFEAQSPSPTTTFKAVSPDYSAEGTVRVAPAGQDPMFSDLDPKLQELLRVQLQKPGDVSAVVETDGAFLIFVARERTDTILGADVLSLSKPDFETWLAGQCTTAHGPAASR